MLHYWLNQREAMTTLAEPYCAGRIRISPHPVRSQPETPSCAQHPGWWEFGVVQTTLARIRAGVTEFAAEKSAFYKALADGVTKGDASTVDKAMTAILAQDRHWTLHSDPPSR